MNFKIDEIEKILELNKRNVFCFKVISITEFHFMF